MQISGFTTTLPQNSVLTTLTPKNESAVRSSASESADSKSSALVASASTKSTTASATTAAKPAAHAGGGGAASTSSAASSGSVADTLAAVYSTTVGGVQYNGSVEQSGNEYSVSIPNLPGATASGSSILSVENKLANRIDEIV